MLKISLISTVQEAEMYTSVGKRYESRAPQGKLPVSDEATSSVSPVVLNVR